MKILTWMKSKLLPKDLRDPAASVQTERNFAERLEAAAATPDPVQRLDAALKVENDLYRYDDQLTRNLKKSAEKSSLVSYGIAFALGAAGGLALSAAIFTAAPALFITFAFGVSVGTLSLPADGIIERLQKKGIASHRGAIDGAREKTAGLVQETLEKHGVEIGSSPGFAETHGNSWRLCNAVALAFNKAVLRGDIQATPPAVRQSASSAPLKL